MFCPRLPNCGWCFTKLIFCLVEKGPVILTFIFILLNNNWPNNSACINYYWRKTKLKRWQHVFLIWKTAYSEIASNTKSSFFVFFLFRLFKYYYYYLFFCVKMIAIYNHVIKSTTHLLSNKITCSTFNLSARSNGGKKYVWCFGSLQLY